MVHGVVMPENKREPSRIVLRPEDPPDEASPLIFCTELSMKLAFVKEQR
jgi:hypothetical protein